MRSCALAVLFVTSVAVASGCSRAPAERVSTAAPAARRPPALLVAPDATITTAWDYPKNPLTDASLGNTPLAVSIKQGFRIFTNTPKEAARFTAGGMSCSNCHLNAGQRERALPVVGIAGMFPEYNRRAGRIYTLTDRVIDCFLRSENATGRPQDAAASNVPTATSSEVLAVTAYLTWLSADTPMGTSPAWRGRNVIAPEALIPLDRLDRRKGAAVYGEHCASCHAPDGQGIAIGDLKPGPLWGPGSWNDGAGAARVYTLAGIIRYSMPYSQPGSLGDADAQAVAAFINSQPRPAFPFKAQDYLAEKLPPDSVYYPAPIAPRGPQESEILSRTAVRRAGYRGQPGGSRLDTGFGLRNARHPFVVLCRCVVDVYRRQGGRMARTGWGSPLAAAVCATTLLAVGGVGAQQPPAGAQAPAGARGGGAGGGRGGAAATVLFTAADADKNGSVSREEFKGTFDKWFTAWDGGTGALTQDQLAVGLNGLFPQAPAGGRGGPQNQTPKPEDLAAMMAALPSKAPATPLKPRKILVLGKAQGFVHSSIPLAAKTVEALGDKTKAWSTTITYDPADINADNLKQYDAIFLASTTGTFLDDPTIRRQRRRGARPCWTSFAAARGSRAFTRRATRITATRRQQPAAPRLPRQAVRTAAARA